MIDRKEFYDRLKPFVFKTLLQPQVNGMESILEEWDKSGFTDKRWLAYMLATAYHETDKTMQPIEEYGKGKNKPYGRKIKHSGASYILPDKIYYGRGLVQLTWFENYELIGRLLSIDLLNNPEDALLPQVAVKILFEGMTKGASSFGDFTGKCLEMYFNNVTENWEGARKIINGTDKKKLIAGYAIQFNNALA